jgi:hypothetical protein
MDQHNGRDPSDKVSRMATLGIPSNVWLPQVCNTCISIYSDNGFTEEAVESSTLSDFKTIHLRECNFSKIQFTITCQKTMYLELSIRNMLTAKTGRHAPRIFHWGGPEAMYNFMFSFKNYVVSITLHYLQLHLYTCEYSYMLHNSITVSDLVF